MALKPGDISNFKTLLKAAKHGNLGLMECRDAKTGEYRAVICAMVTGDDGVTNMTPFGNMFLENGYEEYVPADEVSTFTGEGE